MATPKPNIRLKFDDIVPKMMKTLGAKTHTELAEYLGVSPQSLSNFSKRGHIPIGMVVNFALKKGVPVEDFLKIKEVKLEAGPDKYRVADSMDHSFDPSTELSGLVSDPDKVERRKYLKLRKMVDAITRSEITNEAMPELIIAGLPNITSFIIRQKYLDTHGLYF